MSSSNNKNQSDGSSKKIEVLYEEFLKTVGTEDEVAPSAVDRLGNCEPTCLESSPLSQLEKCPSTCLKSSTDPESVQAGEEGDSDAPRDLTGEEKERFIKRIYEPVLNPWNVHGFDGDVQTLKLWLLNEKGLDSFKLLGVIGMLGVGKTALCRLILDEEEVKQRYFPRFLVPLSQPNQPRSMENVVKSMLEHLGVEDGTINSISQKNKLPGLLYALHLRLKGKKFLIVLDDAKQEDEYYEELTSLLRDGPGFPQAYGGAVILNGRHEEPIKKIVGERNVHQVQLLSNQEDCWRIYQSLALGGDGAHPSARTIEGLEEVKTELMKKCGGLPLAARIMGELKRLEINKSKTDKTSGDAMDASTDKASTQNLV